MFHRHHAARPKPGREQQWEQITGDVVDKRLLPAKYPPHPEIFGVQLPPEGREPFRAEVKAAMDLAPYCALCHQPLQAQPRARFWPGRVPAQIEEGCQRRLLRDVITFSA